MAEKYWSTRKQGHQLEVKKKKNRQIFWREKTIIATLFMLGVGGGGERGRDGEGFGGGWRRKGMGLERGDGKGEIVVKRLK